jgi:threonine/homoserine/homoserine lactone efflux protein
MIFSVLLYNIVPTIQLPMKILEIIYLLYLIYKTLFTAETFKTKNNSGSFVIGLVLQLINPRIIIFGLTAKTTYILPYYSDIPILLLIAVILSIIIFTGTICWSFFGSILKKAFNKHEKMLNIIMVILLLYCIVSLFL